MSLMDIRKPRRNHRGDNRSDHIGLKQGYHVIMINLNLTSLISQELLTQPLARFRHESF